MTRTPTRIALAGLVAVAAAPAGGASPTAGNRTVEVRVVENDGFQWADAGIGALAALGVTLAATGTAIVLLGGARDRDRPTRGVRK